MQSEVKQRLIKYLTYLGIGQKAFAEYVGVSAGFVNSIRVSIQPKTLEKISSAYPELNTSWLLTGEGPMLKENSSSATIVDKLEEGGKVIRYWREINSTGGGVESFNDIKSDYVPVTLPDFNDCTDAVNIVGESMEPTYKSGSIILLKEWTESFIYFGNPYMVITRNGNRMVKILRSVENNPSVVKCESINTNYDPFEIQKSDILRLYIVKGVISKINM